MKFGDKSFFA